MLKNSIRLLAGNVGLILLQAVQFFLLARTLQAEVFGVVAAISSLITIFVPLSDVGLGHVLQRYGAKDIKKLSPLCRNALGVNVVVGILFVVIITIGAQLVYRGEAPTMLVICIAISELVLFRIVWIIGQAQAAQERFGETALFMVLTALCRVCAVIVFLLFGFKNPLIWSATVIFFSGFLIAYALNVMKKNIVFKQTPFDFETINWKEGVPFAMTDMSRNLATDLDKVLLGRYCSLEIMGPYTVAFRIISLVMAPVKAMLQASRSKMYKLGVEELRQILKMMAKLIQFGLIYTTTACILIFFSAAAIPAILGPSYVISTSMLRLFCVLPILQLLSLSTSEILIGIGAVRYRLLVQTIANFILLFSGIFLIRNIGWEGAVFSVYLAETTLAILSWFVIYRTIKKGKAN